MRRVLTIGVVLAAAVAFVVLSMGAQSGENATKKYWVELDNAFGLIEGADVKVGGTRAGKITDMELDRDKFYARIGIELDQKGFGDLRKDAECETRPQSLIGEYFMDCQPGKEREALPEGGTVPVHRTKTTVHVDLVQNIYRRPYRERFSILLSEFGAGLAARGEDLNETIRRANPALRETDRVLRVLAEQKRVIRDLYENADEVLKELADDRTEVSRFVLEARDTAVAAGSRAEGIRRQWNRFPTFLRELRPTLRLLGESAQRQEPALRNLNASADFLERFFDTLGPFAEASRPAFRTLAGAARAGRPAIRAARPNIAELAKAVKPLPETAGNLAITLEHIDDPRFAPEKDKRRGRPGDVGYTGLESVLRYIFAQSQAINMFDANSYMLKVNGFVDRDCAFYVNAETVKDPAKEHCKAWLGPNQPGITSPDFTKQGGGGQRSARARSEGKGGRDRDGGDGGEARDERPAAPGPQRRGPDPLRPPSLDGILGKLAPGGAPKLPAAPRTPDASPVLPRGGEGVLDYLLGS
jgi:ABC-type transporter Mla subunit MlaD